MYELRTTAGTAHGHPELVIALEDPALAEQGSHWISALDRRLAAGERFEVGRVPDLDGWPLAPTLRSDGALALHARILENYRAEGTTLSLDGHARLAQAQRRFAMAYAAFDPPHWLMSVLACPRWRTSAEVLTREEPVGNRSGWVIACDEKRCPECARDPRFHCPSGEWLMLDLAEIAVARPSLVRFLGLPPGHRIRAPFGRCVVHAFDLEHGHDLARLATDEFGTAHLRRELAPSAATSDDAAIDLDFARDADVFEGARDDYVLTLLLRERYGLSDAAAAATLGRARSLEVALAHARWRVREVLTPEQCAVLEAALQTAEPERWKVVNDAARKLVPLTGKPFLQWKPIAEAFDTVLQRGRRRP